MIISFQRYIPCIVLHKHTTLINQYMYQRMEHITYIIFLQRYCFCFPCYCLLLLLCLELSKARVLTLTATHLLRWICCCCFCCYWCCRMLSILKILIKISKTQNHPIFTLMIHFVWGKGRRETVFGVVTLVLYKICSSYYFYLYEKRWKFN